MTDPVSRLGEIKANAREGATTTPAVQQHADWAFDVRHQGEQTVSAAVRLLVEAAPQLALDRDWLLEHIEQLQDEIDRRNTPWQTSDLWGRMSAADPEIREALIQAWNERDRLGAQRQSVLDLCDRNASEVYPAGIFDPFIQLLRIALGADDDR